MRALFICDYLFEIQNIRTHTRTHTKTHHQTHRFQCECGMIVQFHEYVRYLPRIASTPISDRFSEQHQTPIRSTGVQRIPSHSFKTALLSRVCAVRQRSPPSASQSNYRSPALSSPLLLLPLLAVPLASDPWPLFARGTARPRPHHPNPIRLGPRRPRKRASCYTVAV